MTSLHDQLPQTTAVIDEGIARGLHRGVQLSVSRDGEVVADGAVGTSYDDVPLTGETILPWLSAGKPLTAVCLLRLIESGQIQLDTKVAEIIPEFAATSRQITILQLLTHTAGLAPVSIGWPRTAWDEVIARICAGGVREDWVPGDRAAYDPVRSWYLLGEMIRRIDGRPFPQIIHEDVLRPIGMHNSWIAMPAEQHAQYGDRIGRTYLIQGREQQMAESHTEEYCGSPSPGSSCRGPIRELRLFYDMLLAGGVTRDGRRLLNAEAVELMTTRHREGLHDETFGHQLDFGLGVIVNSIRYGADIVTYGYGPYASERSFGHGGARSSIAFADPEAQLTVCLVANGAPSELQHHKRMQSLLVALYDDMRLSND